MNWICKFYFFYFDVINKNDIGYGEIIYEILKSNINRLKNSML